MSEKHTCCKRVYSGSFTGHICGRGAKYENDGKWYCKTHDPVSVKEKNDIREAEWRAEREARQRNRDAAETARKTLQDKAEMFDHLLATLKMAIQYIPENSITQEAYENGGKSIANYTRCVIAKAEAIK